MTTREELRSMIRLRLGDIAETPTLSDDQINQWIDDGLREYAIHFPRLSELHISCSAAVREYVLDGRTDESGITINGARMILGVEYPYGKHPPQTLLRRSEQDGRGFLGENVYDVRNGLSITLVLGPLPGGTETMGVQVACDYPVLTLDTDEILIPARHLELIVLSTRWMALQELATTEALDPSPTGVILSGLSSMLSRAREDYQSRLDEYLKQHSSGGEMVCWGD